MLIFFFLFAKETDFSVSGTISEQNGNPIPFVTVTLKGTRIATASDQNGKYQLKTNADKGVLVFSALGYSSKEVKFNKKNLINVTLEQAKQELESVVIAMPAGEKQRAYSDKSAQKRFVNTTGYQVYNKYDADEDGNTENYDHITENAFHKVTDDPLSTFSIDVDAASYSNVRRYLNDDQLPPAGAVRIEEMVNYFKYKYPSPTADKPFSVTTEMSDCPWNTKNKLLLIGLQGKQIPVENLPASNLVFLIDVSGSMASENKLPLVKASMKLLTDQLREQDKISIVVYAGSAGLVLPATSGNQKQKIKTAIDALESGGSTAGGAGIKLAYKIAAENLLKNGNNRVILCTDGDFNVGASSDDDMVRLIEKEREQGVFLTVLGYGMGNYKDNKMQQLADKGNGNHAYIDGMSEAKKVLVNEFGGTLFTIAKDVKLQIEFNPAKIAGYRLIGYENRMLNKEDFKDDKKDAGELGSGHSVTALYEIIPAGVSSEFLKDVDPLKYQQPKKQPAYPSDDFLTVKLRYKEPTGTKSQLIEQTVKGSVNDFSKTSSNFRFAASVASFGMLLRKSEFKGSSSFQMIIQNCSAALDNDQEGYKKEFISLVKKAAELSEKMVKVED